MIDQDLLQRVKDRLEAAKGNLPLIAAATDVSYFTILNIMSGRTENPHRRTVAALDEYFRKQEAKAKRQAR